MTESMKGSIFSFLYQPEFWPDKEMLSLKRAWEIIERIVTEIQGVENMPYPRMGMDATAKRALRPGYLPLVFYEG